MSAVTTNTNDPSTRALFADELISELPDDAIVELLVDQFRFYVDLGLSQQDAVVSSVASLRLAFDPELIAY
jgi:hypothetical protein